MVTNFSSKKVNGKENGLQKNHKKVLGKLSHYRFRQRLAQKCLEYRCHYIEVTPDRDASGNLYSGISPPGVTEEYTSKTCCNCDNQKHDLGTKKHYNCDKCNMSIDRDTNGAIKIQDLSSNAVFADINQFMLTYAVSTRDPSYSGIVRQMRDICSGGITSQIQIFPEWDNTDGKIVAKIPTDPIQSALNMWQLANQLVEI